MALVWDADGRVSLLDALSRLGLAPVDTTSVFLGVLAAAEAQELSIIVEFSYYDLDIRSEIRHIVNRFYAGLTLDSPRLAFFADLACDPDDPEAMLDQDGALDQADCLGYTVLRMRSNPTMARTMLEPRLFGIKHAAVRCAEPEQINVLGREIELRAFPFMQQDSILTSCFHANLWMAFYSMTLKGLLPRTTAGGIGTALGEIADSLNTAPNSPIFPNETVNVQTAIDLARRSGLVTRRTQLGAYDPDKLRLEIEAHLNSGFPITITYSAKSRLADVLNSNVTSDIHHSVIVCGFERDDVGKLSDLIVHDDQTGLYRKLPMTHLFRLSAEAIANLERDDEEPDNWDLDQIVDGEYLDYLTVEFAFFAPQGVWIHPGDMRALAELSIESTRSGFEGLRIDHERWASGLHQYRTATKKERVTDFDMSDAPYSWGIEQLSDEALLDLESYVKDQAELRGALETSFGGLVAGPDIAIRCYAILGTVFKARFLRQNSSKHLVSLDRELLRRVAALALPKFVLVVEYIDHVKWRSNTVVPCVHGEVLLDASSTKFDPRTISIRFGSDYYMSSPSDFVFAKGSKSALTYSSRSDVVPAGYKPSGMPPHKSATRSGF